MMSKKGKLVLWVIVSLILGMLFMNMYLNLNEMNEMNEMNETEVTINKPNVAEIQYKPYLQRNEINDAVKSMMEQGRMQDALKVYESISGDPSLTHTIMNYAVKYDIPISLLFSIVSVESNFNSRALNKNRNGTHDYGLMSLNSRTFTGYSKEQLYEIEINLKLGCEYLLMLKNKYKTWGEAVIHYNGLYTKGAASYMVKVLEREREFERLFNEMI
jgi:soluble lytic murein transglycosylase-like protein